MITLGNALYRITEISVWHTAATAPNFTADTTASMLKLHGSHDDVRLHRGHDTYQGPSRDETRQIHLMDRKSMASMAADPHIIFAASKS